MDPNQLGGAVSFIREAGFLGLLVAFCAALYFGKVYFGRDYDKLAVRLAALEELIADKDTANRQLATTLEKVTQILERATGGLTVSVARRIALEDGVPVNDVMADMDNPKIRTREVLAIPLPTRPRRSRSSKVLESGPSRKSKADAA